MPGASANGRLPATGGHVGSCVAQPPQRAVRPAPRLSARGGGENARAGRLRPVAARSSGALGDITNLVNGRAPPPQKLPVKPSAPAAPPPPVPPTILVSSSEDSWVEQRFTAAGSTDSFQAHAAGVAGTGIAERTAGTADGTGVAAVASTAPAVVTSSTAVLANGAAASGATASAASAASAAAAAALAAAEGADEAAGSPQDVQEYVREIYAKMFHDEVLYLPRPNYMDSQRDINGRMRAILVDWLVEVHMKYQLRIETLFLAVSLIDRYLARMPVRRGRLQLVGVVAMFVASKFEELRPPDVHDFVYITDNTYSKDDILILECTMLTTLGFHVAGPTAAQFLALLQRACGCDEAQRQLAQYAAELALVEISMLRHTPSHLAAAAMLVSNEILGRQPVWPAAMARHSRHAEHALQSCAQELRALLRGAATTPLQAVRKKFSQPRHQSVARLPV